MQGGQIIVEYVTLGKTGIEVSELCMGTMTFGKEADKETSKEIFKRARDAGINFFDTANIYADPNVYWEDVYEPTEIILGELIKDCRDDIVLTTKIGGSRHDKPNDGGLSRKHILQEVEDCLRRLKTDYIDLLFLHKKDKNTPLEEILQTLDDLQRQGKILYPAISNYPAWEIAISLGISKNKGLARFECIQPMYNLVKRQAEVEILPLAHSENIGVISYSPLAAGLLTGKYTHKSTSKGRMKESERYSKRYKEEMNYRIAEDFVNYAEEQGVNPVSLAVAWVKAHPAVTAPIIGARNVEQLEGSLKAVEIDMTPEWREEISELSYSPPPATDRSENMDWLDFAGKSLIWFCLMVKFKYIYHKLDKYFLALRYLLWVTPMV